MRSILQGDDDIRCYFCGKVYGLERHHIMAGVANKPLSELFGLWIWCCHECHTGRFGVQYDKQKNWDIKAVAQEEFEKIYGHDEWMRVFRKNYIYKKTEEKKNVRNR